MPKDYADISGFDRGANMAMQALGIKDKKEQAQWKMKLEQHAMKIQDLKDKRETEAFNMTVGLNKIKLDEANSNKILNEIKIQNEQLEAQKKSMEVQEKQKAFVRKGVNEIRTNLILGSGLPMQEQAAQLANIALTQPDMTGKDMLGYAEKIQGIGKEPYKIGQSRYVDVGDQKIEEMYTGKGKTGWESTGRTAPRYKPASTTVNISGEKFALQKEISVGEMRTNLIKAKDDKENFEANSPLFNKNNNNNEIAYWNEKSKWYQDEEAKIVKLPQKALDLGWTPTLIQESANAKGITIQQVLKEIGVLQ